MSRKFLIVCGGTGGHLAPGIAVAEELIGRGHRCSLLISTKQVDSRLVQRYSPKVGVPPSGGPLSSTSRPMLRSEERPPKGGTPTCSIGGEGDDLHFIRVPGAAFGRRPKELVKFGVGFCKGMVSGARILRREKPDLVIAFGGFLSLGVVLFAAARGVPIAIHEANRVPGRAVRLLRHFATRIYLPPGVELSGVDEKKRRDFGYPVRKEFGFENAGGQVGVPPSGCLSADRDDRRGPPEGGTPTKGGPPEGGTPTKGEPVSAFARYGATGKGGTPTGGDEAAGYAFHLGLPNDGFLLTVFGGSQGASALNHWVDAHCRELLRDGMHLFCVRGMGKGAEAEIEEFDSAGNRRKCVTVGFCDAMHKVLAASDLVLSRAGAGSIAEITRCGVPAILVPFPFAADGHQQENARYFAERGGGIVIEQENLERLKEEVLRIYRDPAALEKMRENLRALEAENRQCELIADLEALAASRRRKRKRRNVPEREGR